MPYKRIKVQHYNNRLFAFCDGLYRMRMIFGDEGMIDAPECLCTGKTRVFHDDDTIYLLDTDKVRISMQRIALHKRKHL